MASSMENLVRTCITSKLYTFFLLMLIEVWSMITEVIALVDFSAISNKLWEKFKNKISMLTQLFSVFQLI